VGYLLELRVRWGFFYKKFPYLVFGNLQKNSHFGPFLEMNWPRRKEPPWTLWLFLSGEMSQLRSHLHILHGVHWVAGGRRRPEANFKPHWEVTCLTRRWMRLITLFPCLRNFFDEEFCKNLCWWCGWWWDWLLCSHALEFFLWRLLQNLCWWCGCNHHPTIAIPISKVSSHGQICYNLVATLAIWVWFQDLLIMGQGSSSFSTTPIVQPLAIC